MANERRTHVTCKIWRRLLAYRTDLYGMSHRVNITDLMTDDRMQIFYWSNEAQHTRILPSCHGGTSHDDESDNDVDVGVYH